MRISLNTEEHDLAEGSTVEALLAQFKLDTRKVAVEVNLAIVPRSLYADTPLKDGDRIEIVKFIGGG
jgi:thiamine biosynthesis protein ThiS